MSGTLAYVQGDVFETGRQAILVHQVNGRGKMGSGVARQIADRFPEVKEAYLLKHRRTGWELGSVQFVGVDHPVIKEIVNLCGQDGYGYDGRLYTDYAALERGLATVFRYAEGESRGVSLPLIGCGLAGGSWEVVEKIIRGLLVDRQVQVDVHVL